MRSLRRRPLRRRPLRRRPVLRLRPTRPRGAATRDRRPRDHSTGVWAFGLMALTLVGVLVTRLGQVQVLDHAAYQQLAQEADTRTVAQPAVRGRILDSAGEPLVDNTTRTTVTISRTQLLDAPDGGRTIVGRVASALGLKADQLWGRTFLCGTQGAPPAPTCWGGSPYVPVPLAIGVDPAKALGLLERPDLYPGVDVVAEPVRDFPQDATVNAAQLLGYLGRPTADEVTKSKGQIGDLDLVGRGGLEQQYDAQLRGRPGETTVTVDPRGAVTGEVDRRDPVPGSDLVTTIDSRVQGAAEKALATAVRDARARGQQADGGAAVLLDVRTGGVVAAASYPTYDPGIWTGGVTAAQLQQLTGKDSGNPLVSRVTGATYPPASTFKAISLPAAIGAGNPLDKKYDCTSSYRIGDRSFANFESRAYGPITLKRAIEVSCDTIFYDFAYRSWLAQGGLEAATDAKDPFVAMANEFGLGTRTGIDLPGEVAGRVPSRDQKLQAWKDTRADTCTRARTGYPEVARTDPSRAAYLKALAVENCRTGFQFRGGDAANLAIGQGDVATTPLQMARAYAAIANGGTVWTPQVVREIRSVDGSVTTVAPQAAGTVTIPPKTLAYLRSALQGVVTDGSAEGAFRGFPLQQWPIAGKTGTAESFGAGDTAWFLSYAPANAPRYAVAVVVAHGGLGGSTAAPAARAIHDVLRTLP